MAYCIHSRISDVYVISLIGRGQASRFKCFGKQQAETLKRVHATRTAPVTRILDRDGTVIDNDYWVAEMPDLDDGVGYAEWRRRYERTHPGPHRTEATGEYFDAANVFECDTEQEMIDHLLHHRSAGHLVPDVAILSLRREAWERV